MQTFDANKDYAYFASLWGDNDPKKADNPMSNWDNRAESWELLLGCDSAFKQSLNERVIKAASFLRERGLLDPHSMVADIGCGTGRFITEFAKTAGHVTGIDVSEKMLGLARRHSEENGITNTSYILSDFTRADVDKEGWAGAFDLVFTSITGAIDGVSNLEKLIRMSKGYCFNSSFIRNCDDLEKEVAINVFGIDLKPAYAPGGRSFYALFNLVWLAGYFPETCYHKQLSNKMVPVDDELAEYYTWSIFKETKADAGAKIRIKEYLLKNSVNEMIRQYTERWYGWILWDVREKDRRV